MRYRDDNAILPFESRLIWSTVRGRFSLRRMARRDSLGCVTVTALEFRSALEISFRDNFSDDLSFGMLALYQIVY